MYSTCLFCGASLGSNGVIERLPVGRRLAFDAARGRLWVVCRRCERWNLTPIEERWEAIEACERHFRETRLRVSTDNIGLARLAEGLELVRIGSALRPEFAAWRYGDQFGRRRRRHLVLTGAGVTAGFGILIAGPMLGLLAGGSWAAMNIANALHNVVADRRVRVRLRVPDRDGPLPLHRRELRAVVLAPGPEAMGWSLRVPLPVEDPWYTFALESRHRWTDHPLDAALTLTGRAALDAAGQLLPHFNATGARQSTVQTAVRLIEGAGDPQRLFVDLARRGAETRSDEGAPIPMHALPTEMRLALEMVSHEEAERRAMEGELALLAAAWRQAEEIAAIADGLLVSPDVDEWIERARGPATSKAPKDR